MERALAMKLPQEVEHNSLLSIVTNIVGVNAREKIGLGLPVARFGQIARRQTKISVENFAAGHGRRFHQPARAG
jgi:hypothetical protein